MKDSVFYVAYRNFAVGFLIKKNDKGSFDLWTKVFEYKPYSNEFEQCDLVLTCLRPNDDSKSTAWSILKAQTLVCPHTNRKQVYVLVLCKINGAADHLKTFSLVDLKELKEVYHHENSMQKKAFELLTNNVETHLLQNHVLLLCNPGRGELLALRLDAKEEAVVEPLSGAFEKLFLVSQVYSHRTRTSNLEFVGYYRSSQESGDHLSKRNEWRELKVEVTNSTKNMWLKVSVHDQDDRALKSLDCPIKTVFFNKGKSFDEFNLSSIKNNLS